MNSNLEVRQEQLVHTAFFERPLLALWGEGKTVVNGLYEAFAPFGITLADIRAEGMAPAEQVVIVNFGFGAHKFHFDHVETSFFQFSQDAFQKIPVMLDASLGWIRGAVADFRVASHQFVHSTHSALKQGTVEELLHRIGPTGPGSGGISKGNGAIFHWDVPTEG